MLLNFVLILPLLLLGCATPQTVNRAELERLKAHCRILFLEARAVAG